MNDPEDRIIRALKSWAELRQPSPALTDRIVAQAQRRSRRRRAGLGATAAVAVGAAIGVPLATLGAGHGQVIRVATRAGSTATTYLNPQTSGSLTCSTPSTATAMVPELLGRSYTQALSVLDAVHVKAFVVNVQAGPTVRAGSVIAEAPPAGSKVAVGSTVTLTVAGHSPTSSSPTSAARAIGSASTASTQGPRCTPSMPTTTAPAETVPTSHPGDVCPNGGSSFTLSLVSATGGQPNPQAAAQFFALHRSPPFPVPRSGWVVISQDSRGATVRSGSVSLHVIEGPDHTWQVDSGNRCS